MKTTTLTAVTLMLLTSTLASAEEIAHCDSARGDETVTIERNPMTPKLISGALIRHADGKTYEFPAESAKYTRIGRDDSGSFGDQDQAMKYNLDLFIRMFGPIFQPDAVTAYTQYTLGLKNGNILNMVVLTGRNEKILFSGFNFKGFPGKQFYRVCR